MFTRVLMDLKVNGDFPEEIYFTDDEESFISQKVIYDWKPILCSKCKQLGHLEVTCKAGLRPAATVPAPIPQLVVPDPILPTPEEVNDEGFQLVRNGSRADSVDAIGSQTEAATVITANGFDVLVGIGGDIDRPVEYGHVLGTLSHSPNV